MSRKQTEPLELEVMPVHEIELRKFIVTAYSVLPADHLKDEPDIRVEIEAASGCAAGVQVMRLHRRNCYYYMKIRDISPPKKRRSHVESVECTEEPILEESQE
jgi:hypothetical protein